MTVDALCIGLYIFYCQILYSNGVGSQVLTTLVTTLPLQIKHTLKLINMAKHVQIHMNTYTTTKQIVNYLS